MTVSATVPVGVVSRAIAPNEGDASGPTSDRVCTTTRGRATDGGRPSRRLRGATRDDARPIPDDTARTIRDDVDATIRSYANGDARRRRPIRDTPGRVPHVPVLTSGRPPSQPVQGPFEVSSGIP